MKVTKSFVKEAKRIDNLYEEALHILNLPLNNADGDALMGIIEQHSKYKTSKKHDELFNYITEKIW